MKLNVVISKSAIKDYNLINEPFKSNVYKNIEKLRIYGFEWNKVESLTGDLKGLFRIRVGDYRIIFRKLDDIVQIIAILHRKDAYKK